MFNTITHSEYWFWWKLQFPVRKRIGQHSPRKSLSKLNCDGVIISWYQYIIPKSVCSWLSFYYMSLANNFRTISVSTYNNAIQHTNSHLFSHVSHSYGIQGERKVDFPSTLMGDLATIRGDELNILLEPTSALHCYILSRLFYLI